MYQGHREGTSGCSPDTSTVTVFPPQLNFASCKWMGVHPFENRTFSLCSNRRLAHASPLALSLPFPAWEYNPEVQYIFHL